MDEVFNQTVDFPGTSTTLNFLKPYSFYTIQVLAFTVKGDGPKSPPIIVRTEEEGKTRVVLVFNIFPYILKIRKVQTENCPVSNSS